MRAASAKAPDWSASSSDAKRAGGIRDIGGRRAVGVKDCGLPIGRNGRERDSPAVLDGVQLQLAAVGSVEVEHVHRDSVACTESGRVPLANPPHEGKPLLIRGRLLQHLAVRVVGLPLDRAADSSYEHEHWKLTGWVYHG